MKNILTKSVGIILILLMLISSLVGCVEPEIEVGGNTGGEENQGEETKRFGIYISAFTI